MRHSAAFDMHWRRIAFFVVIGFIGTAAAAFPVGFIAGFAGRASKEVLLVTQLGGALAGATVLTSVFGRLAYIQRERVAGHVYTTAFLMWGISFVPNVVLLEQPPSQWLVGAVVTCACATVALGIVGVLRRATATRSL